MPFDGDPKVLNSSTSKPDAEVGGNRQGVVHFAIVGPSNFARRSRACERLPIDPPAPPPP
jgi:hypothetical protein